MKSTFSLAAPLVLALSAAVAGPVAAQPANDTCADGAVVPSDFITYNPPLVDTTAALTEICGAQESCEEGGVGTRKSVWYTYTPDRDGLVEIDTVGDTTYDTVLSVHDGCGRLISIGNCELPNEFACNDNYFFGLQSQVFLDVTEGETYHIKVAGYGPASPGGLLDFNMRYHPPNESCQDSTVVDSSTYDPPLLSTHNATVETCEAQESCEVNNVGVSNSVWYSVTPLDDGLLSVDTAGSDYDTVLSVWEGCREDLGLGSCGPLPLEIACDDDSGPVTTSSVVDVPVEGGTTYRIKVAGYNTTPDGGYLDFNVTVSGPSMDPEIFDDGFESGDTSAWSSGL